MEENQKKLTVGAASIEASQKKPETLSPIELERAMQEEYMKHLLETVDDGYKKYDSDFYVVVITKNERLMQNVFRNYFFHRKSCPTPEYDQSVYKYNRPASRMEYMWTLPSKDACIHLKNNADKVVKEEQQLLDFVLKFYNGTLDRFAKKENGEEINSPLLVKG